MSVFSTVLTSVGSKLSNHDLYKAAKAEYIKRGYSQKKARYAALGMMSSRSQSGDCIFYAVPVGIEFKRTN